MKTIKTCLFIIMAVIFLSACVDGSAAESGETFHLSEVSSSSFESVKEIDITDGTMGEKLTISAAADIADLLNKLEQMELTEYEMDEPGEGYLWWVKLISDEAEFDMTDNRMGDRYFEMEPSFNEIISGFVTSQNP
ncbi:hypothetical protein [Jeotgalibacillus sp. JSM ZJ347]|uniref:hypothetical protein n=1 Tax=Jeotgalibacillus sp. JSM ZJ347 TaxID=3342117 RepID=UPI0035A8BB2A